MLAKLKYSACLFPTEWRKIEFVRVHLREQAFSIVEPFVMPPDLLPESLTGLRDLEEPHLQFTTVQDLFVFLDIAYKTSTHFIRFLRALYPYHEDLYRVVLSEVLKHNHLSKS